MRYRKFIFVSLVATLLCVMTMPAYSAQSYHRPFVPEISRDWTEMDPAQLYPDFQYEGLTPSCAACPGCDPEFTFFVKGGRVNKLVIYFQGGGACWDSMNCLYAHTYSEEVPDISEFENTQGRGIFDTENPKNPFKDWYFVYIPYCTGDIHWGAQDVPYPDYLDGIPGFDSWTIRHRGFVNFQVVLKWIEDNFRLPFKIFVTGSSAGGYGAIMGFPYIKEAFPISRVYVLGDAANGVVGEDFQNASIYNWNIQIPEWIPGFEAGYTPDLEMSDVYINIANYYPFSKLAQFTTAWDWNQTFFYYVMLNINNPGTWETDWPLVWCDWNSQMIDSVYETAAEARNYRYYIAAGDYHTIMMSPEFYTENSAGISYARWVRVMVNNPFGMWGGPWQGLWRNVECVDCDDPMLCP
jgi:hypothetical protein